MKKIIPHFKPEHGLHCVSNSIKQIFHYNHYRITEEMIFGISSGLNFFYFEFKHSPAPIIGGRIKIGDFEENLSSLLNIKIKINETTSKKKAFEELKSKIYSDIPVMIYVDMAYLPYLNLPEEYHFGGHSIVVFGMDEEHEIAFISDRDGKDFKITMNENEIPEDFHIISLENLELARSSKEKPFPPRNKWLNFNFDEIIDINDIVVIKSIRKNAESFLYPPIKNLGINGIELFSEKLREWIEFDDDLLREAAINAYFMINQLGGTGGGCFRKMYGNFLIESGDMFHNDFLERSGEEFIKIAELWDIIGDKLFKTYETSDRNLLKECSERAFIIFLKERELFLRLYEFVGKSAI